MDETNGTIKIFPWEKGEKPYFINDDGFHWYIQKEMTEWCNRQNINNSPPIKAVCFLVAKNNKPEAYVLIDKNNNILHVDNTMDGMGCKIDILRIKSGFDNIK